MPLTHEERLELLKNAREAKKAKRDAKITAPKPIPEPIPEHVPEPIPEPIPEPVKPSVKKTTPKWIKKPDKCCKIIKDDGVISKEEYLINDEEPEPATPIAEPPKPIKVVKPRKVKEPVRTLDIKEPEPIEIVMEDLVNNDAKYKIRERPQPKQPNQKEVIITKTTRPVSLLFDY